jgi:hypothetical protein
MKTKFTVIAFAILSSYAFCQDEKKESSHDIGFNTNIVFNGIFNSNNNSSYNFIYKVQKTPTRANRYSVNFSINLDNWNGKQRLATNGFGIMGSTLAPPIVGSILKVLGLTIILTTSG